MEDLIIEIGTEELPASVVNPALEFLREKLSELLRVQGIETFCTPRRLAFYVSSYEDKPLEVEEEIWGPPVRVAYDEEGKPTKALSGFLSKNEASLEEVKTGKKGKGEYVVIRRVRKEGTPLSKLQEEFENLLLSIPFPKRMRWTSSKKLTFSRPVRWILALHGDRVIELRFGGLKSDRFTYGHRFLSDGRLSLTHASQYRKVLEDNWVIPSFEERKKRVVEQLGKLSEDVGGEPKYPEGLVEEVVNLVEYPFGVLGTFEEKYLELPEKVIITVCAHHQRFFCIEKDNGLINHFIGISNNRPVDDRIVKGYQKVIRARLEDALFFYKEDLKTPLDALVPRLSQVLVHPKIGTLLDKTRGMKKIARELCKRVGCEKEYLDKLLRAVELSKADVLTQMVNELDELQGYMGYIYALKHGEDEEVALSLEEQYRPRSQEDELPSTLVGALLSVSDKIYDLVAFFSAGEIPKGSSDPYGLRRAAFGLIRIVEDRKWDVNLRDFFPLFDEVKNTEALEDFLTGRLESYLSGYGYDVVRAVTHVFSSFRPYKVVQLSKLLSSLKKEAKFISIVESYKRVVKILPEDWRGDNVREELFKEKEERELYRILRELEGKTLGTPLDLLPLKDPVDNLFDKVMIMDKDKEVRENRLSLLYRIKKLYENFGDLSKLVIEEA